MKFFTLFFATGLGLGYIPIAPGTWGSLLGVALVYLLMPLSTPLYILTILSFTAFSIWISTLAEKILRQKDPSKIVIDEISGILFSFLFVPLSWQTAILGFLIFRVFDIFKPYPIRKVELKFRRGMGVVLDDVLAGIYTCLVMHLLIAGHFV